MKHFAVVKNSTFLSEGRRLLVRADGFFVNDCNTLVLHDTNGHALLAFQRHEWSRVMELSAEQAAMWKEVTA